MRTILIVVLAAIASPALAASSPNAPCAGAEFQQLDFWLGDWYATWEGTPGSPAGRGGNRIVRSYDGCVTEEHFEGGALKGHSVSVYAVGEHRWRQTWVDNQGGFIDLQGGLNSAGDFVLTTLPQPGSNSASRMIFTEIKSDSFTWHWQATQDGQQWSDKWVIHYTRKKPAAH